MKKSKKLNANIKTKNSKRNNVFLLAGLIICLAIILGFYLKNFIFIIIGVLISGLTIFLYYTRQSNEKNNLEKSHENEFVDIINYFEMFLMNNLNIYQAFTEVLSYTSPWMRNKIDTLLSEIDDDKTVKPFITFAKNFKNGAIENVMISIYQMIDDGNNDVSLSQFNLLFDKFEENNRREFILKKENDLEKLNVFPLIGAMITTLILTFSILNVVGEMMNGI